MNISIIKKMTRNDLGLTGSHQAGICIPKQVVNRGFFPELNSEVYNPRVIIPMYFGNIQIDLNYIFYNNRLHGSGTRCEYRLTGIARFLKDQNMSEGEELIFLFDSINKKYVLDVRHKDSEIIENFDEDQPIVIHAGWSLQYK